MNDTERKILIEDTNARLEEASINALEKIVAEIKPAIESGRPERICGLSDLCRAWEGQLVKVNLAAGELHSKNLVAAEREFRRIASDLDAKLREPKNDDGESWKNI